MEATAKWITPHGDDDQLPVSLVPWSACSGYGGPAAAGGGDALKVFEADLQVEIGPAKKLKVLVGAGAA